MAKKKPEQNTAAKPESQTSALNSYELAAARMRGLSEAYGDMPVDAVYRAFMRAGGGGYLLNMPQLQNQRVRAIQTTPADYTKDQIEKFVGDPEHSEKALREISASLSWSTETFDLIQQVKTDMSGFYWYIGMAKTHSKVDEDTAMREWMLAYDIAENLKIQAKAHEIAGLCMRYGKVFYTPRISVDKSHAKVNYAELQQLPEDYCKIVGFNNGPGKYTVAFNLMYFTHPGNDWRQFGDLFEPYMSDFQSVVTEKGRYVYSSARTPAIDGEKFRRNHISQGAGHPKWENIGKVWMYWVTLPADEVVVFEADDRTALVAPPTTGLMVSMTQIPNYEAAQMEIILNPLTSVLTGSLETTDTKNTVTNSDPIRISDPIRQMFESIWYEMLDRNNTSGVGVYLAPAKDLKLQSISDNVSNINIAQSAYSDQVLKSGMSFAIPTTNDPKVGTATLAAKVQANAIQPIYFGMERFMNWLFEELGFRSRLKFHMFGNVFDRESDLEDARKDMERGILPATLRYEAMMGMSPFEDIQVSKLVKKLGILDERLPLITSYSAKNMNPNMPPSAGSGAQPPEVKKDLDPGGRPPEPGSISSETTEKLSRKVKKLETLVTELRETIE